MREMRPQGVWIASGVGPTHSTACAHRRGRAGLVEQLSSRLGRSGGRRRRYHVGLLVLDNEWIDQLYVEPGHTGRGIGADLVAVAKRERPTVLRLWTFEANVGARRFYERHGFVATGFTAGDNEEGAPDVRYEWAPLDTAASP